MRGKALFALIALALTGPPIVSATTISFDYLGTSYGTMTISVQDFNSLAVRYDASSSPPIPSGTEATGFGFTFVPVTTIPNSVSNPTNGEFTWDRNDLNWIPLTNLNAIPNPANSSTITKADFYFGATEGNANNINPPGILPGQSDIFYLNFSGVNFSAQTFDLDNFISVTGVRLQSLPNDINGGSLFLAGGGNGTSVPEPKTLFLLGGGLLGLVGYGRKRMKK